MLVSLSLLTLDRKIWAYYWVYNILSSRGKWGFKIIFCPIYGSLFVFESIFYPIRIISNLTYFISYLLKVRQASISSWTETGSWLKEICCYFVCLCNFDKGYFATKPLLLNSGALTWLQMLLYCAFYTAMQELENLFFSSRGYSSTLYQSTLYEWLTLTNILQSIWELNSLIVSQSIDRGSSYSLGCFHTML